MSERNSHLVGQVLNGTYRLVRLIGEGGMGAVFEGAHTRLPRKVAIKVLFPETVEHPEAVERFHREALVTSDLGHPNIVKVIDFNYTADSVPYIVMELLAGEDLDTRLCRVSLLPPETVDHILSQTASAVNAAHRQGVIHRDLKPPNIFLCQQPHQKDYVKVVDFGISKIHGVSSKLTMPDTVLGSPSYMSPEQACGKSSNVDRRTDVFAMGAILYEMLSARQPFVGSTVDAVLYKVIHEAPPSFAEIDLDLPTALEEVVFTALAKDPAERFNSMAELSQAFSGVMERLARQRLDELEQRETDRLNRITAVGERRGDPAGSEAQDNGEVEDELKTAVDLAVEDELKTEVDLAVLGEVKTEVDLAMPLAEDPAGRPLAPAQAILAPEDEPSDKMDFDTWKEHRVAPKQSSVAASEAGTAPGKASVEVVMLPLRQRGVWIFIVCAVVALAALSAVAGYLLWRPVAALRGGPAAAAAAANTGASGQDSQTVRGDAALVAPDARTPAKTPAPPSNRELWITSTPTGAVVSVQSNYYGRTPLAGRLVSTAKLKVMVSKHGYRSKVKAVPAGSGPVRLEFHLEALSPPHGYLRIAVMRAGKPARALIFVDSKRAGESPLRLKVSPGTHKVEAWRRGDSRQSKTVQVDAGKTQLVVLTLK